MMSALRVVLFQVCMRKKFRRLGLNGAQVVLRVMCAKKTPGTITLHKNMYIV